MFEFERRGESGNWLANFYLKQRKSPTDFVSIKTMYTEAINHDPAVTLLSNRSTVAGRPSIGAWLTYGLGAINQGTSRVCCFGFRADRANHCTIDFGVVDSYLENIKA